MSGPIKCSEGTVYVGGTYGDRQMPELCVDEHEFSNGDSTRLSNLPSSQSPKGFDHPNQPRVQVSGPEAKQICEALGKRLLEPGEWEAIAARGWTQKYSTRSGKLDRGVHSNVNAKATRKVCAARGHYMKYGGKEICDLHGNVSEWTYSPSHNSVFDGKFFDESFAIVGGSWFGSLNPENLYREAHPSHHSNSVGFRCVSDPVEPKK